MNMHLSLPETMDCVGIAGKGGPDVLVLERRPVPQPKEGEVLIRVDAAGVNGPDLAQRAGFYPPPPGASDLPGLEVSGQIVAVGHGVAPSANVQSANIWIGARVCALLSGGGYAQYATADARLCLPVPDAISVTEAAALPETVFTVWRNVFDIGHLKKGETLLVHGGAGGIGSTAIQMAKVFGAHVITTAGSDEKCRFCRTLGADLVINYRTCVFEEEVRSHLGKKGVDVVLDMVGGNYVGRNISVMGERARHVSIAFRSGSNVSFDMMRVMLKRLTLTGSVLRSRPVDEKADIARAVYENVWPLVGAGKLGPVVFRTFPLAEAWKAHEVMERSAHMGKVILKPFSA